MKLKKAPFYLSVFLLVITLSSGIFARDTYAAAPQIRITEIMYDPLGNGDKEFIEIYNGSDSTASLSGWSFSNGVNYTFPSSASLEPGKYAVVVRNSNVFKSAYPNARVFGQYVGKLLGSGELVRLIDSGGAGISQVDYRSGGAWPSAARNGGPSLSIIKANGDETLPSCWGTSTASGGSPGFANAASGGGSCPSKAYLTTPVNQTNPTQPNQNNNQPKQQQTNPQKEQTAPKKEDTPATEDTGDQSLKDLSPEQLAVLTEQAQQEDLEDSSEVTKLGASEPFIKKVAGLLVGIFIISAGAGYILFEKVIKHKNKHPIYAKISQKANIFLDKFKRKPKPREY